MPLDSSSAVLFQRGRLLLGILAGMVTLLLGGQAAQAFPDGDVFVGVGSGQVQERTPGGALVRTLDDTSGSFTTGMAFDIHGNLYVTDFSAATVSTFSPSGSLTGTFGSGYANPESILFDASENVYVGNVFGSILKFDPSGTNSGSFNGRSDWIDLAKNQCTMYYTDEGDSVHRIDVCTSTPLSDFATGLPGSDAFAFRLLPDSEGGGMLLADREEIVRLDDSGSVTQAYDAPGEEDWFALNLDPDGKTFWSADFGTADVYRFNIDTGAKVSHFNTGTGTETVFGLVVKGEITVSQPTLALSPATATNTVGSSHTVIAKITNPGGSTAGQTILFKVSGANPRSGSAKTNGNGQASFTYTGANLGKDTITGCFDKDGNKSCDSGEAKDTATKTWTAPTGGEGPVWEAFHTDPSSGCSARVQQPYLDANQQVTSYTEVICPKATKMTIRSRLRSDHRLDRPLFRNITVAQKGCIKGCVVNQPKGIRFYKLTCPESSSRTFDQDYFTDILLYAGTHKPAVTPFPQRSRPATLSPLCAS